MNRTNQILAVILILQMALAAFIYFDPTSDDEDRTGEALIADFNAENIQSLMIEDQEGNRMELSREVGEWVVADTGGFPANSSTVNNFLNKFKDLRTDDLVARNESSHNRLQVGESEFNRLVTLRNSDGDETKIYVGSSSGSNSTHVRLSDENEVYLVAGLASWEVNPQVSSWIDTVYFTAVRDQVVGLKVENANGVFEFSKSDDGTWTMANLATGERFDSTTINTLLNNVTPMRLTKPIGKDEQESYGFAQPQAVITVTVAEPQEPENPEATETPDAIDLPVEIKTFTLTIGASTENGYYAKSSDNGYIVEIANFTGQPFVENTKESFLGEPIKYFGG